MSGAEQLEANEGFSCATVNNPSASDELVKEIQRSTDIKLSGLYRRGATLFSEGQQARGVYLLHAGRVKVSISSPEGKVLILRLAHAGDLLGLNSALKGSRYDSTAEALELCRTDYIPRADFIKLLDRNTKARRGLFDALSGELTELVEQARSLLLPKSAMEKLAGLLLKWCQQNNHAGAEVIRVQSYLTQEEIAQMICASRETVTRLFGQLRRERIITMVDDTILVRDLRALESLACR